MAPSVEGLLSVLKSAETTSAAAGTKVQVKALGDLDLAYTPVTPCRIVDTRVPQIGPHRLSGERLQRDGRDEARRRLRHRDAHVRAGFHQQARQLGGLVRRDTAGDAEQNLLFAQCRSYCHRIEHLPR